jgi:hypothetical protein
VKEIASISAFKMSLGFWHYKLSNYYYYYYYYKIATSTGIKKKNGCGILFAQRQNRLPIPDDQINVDLFSEYAECGSCRP